MSVPVTLWPPQAAWPENLLRFHLVFARPMDAWHAMDHLALDAATEAAAATALLDLQDGLWNPQQTVLTVLLHPGRVKRGIGALGAALRPGDAVLLRLSGTMADAEGSPLGRDVTFRITVVPAVRTTFQLPAAIAPFGRHAAVSLDLGRPLDLLGATEGLRLTDTSGQPVAHRAEPSALGVILRPATVWPDHVLRLAAAPWLEDACGHRQQAPFEMPLTV